MRAFGQLLRTAVRAQYNRVIVVTTLLVLLPVVVAGERVRRGSGRRLLHWGISIVATLCGIRFEVRGRSALDQPGSVVVANHSSPMDIPALLWADPDVRFVAAADLFRIPLLASAMRAVGTFPIDRRNHDRAHDQLDELVDARRRGGGGDVAFFAEGGIAPAGQRLPFRSGAFTLAIRAASPVVPVAIHGTDRVLPPRGRLLVRSGVVTIEFLDAIDTSGLTNDDRSVLRDHVQDLVCDALDGVGVEPTGRRSGSSRPATRCRWRSSAPARG